MLGLDYISGLEWHSFHASSLRFCILVHVLLSQTYIGSLSVSSAPGSHTGAQQVRLLGMESTCLVCRKVPDPMISTLKGLQVEDGAKDCNHTELKGASGLMPKPWAATVHTAISCVTFCTYNSLGTFDRFKTLKQENIQGL